MMGSPSPDLSAWISWDNVPSSPQPPEAGLRMPFCSQIPTALPHLQQYRSITEQTDWVAPYFSL